VPDAQGYEYYLQELQPPMRGQMAAAQLSAAPLTQHKTRELLSYTSGKT